MSDYVVATVKDWNLAAYERHAENLPGNWHLISNKNDLTIETLNALNPRYIFFPHWSWIVPQDILEMYECVCFHMTDVPYGRGGSPLQNLIVRGHTQTKLTALKMEKELDAGPVYLKHPLKLNGSAHEIFADMADIAYKMMKDIIENEPVPILQTGEVTHFERRTPHMSEIPHNLDLDQLYDHIRMLDAPSYPHAYINHGDFKILFKNARIHNGEIKADITIKTRKGSVS